MWESLLAGAIPVVMRSPAMKPFSDLPILFVNDYREVTNELLETAWNEIRAPSPPHLLMSESYWTQIIRAKQAEIQGDGLMRWGEWIAVSANYGSEMISRRLRITGRAK